MQSITSSSKNNLGSYVGNNYISKNQRMSDEAGLSPVRVSVKIKKIAFEEREGEMNRREPILCAVVIDTRYPAGQGQWLCCDIM